MQHNLDFAEPKATSISNKPIKQKPRDFPADAPAFNTVSRRWGECGKPLQLVGAAALACSFFPPTVVGAAVSLHFEQLSLAGCWPGSTCGPTD